MAAQNKLTITVKVHYENAKYPTEKVLTEHILMKRSLVIQHPIQN